MVADGALQAAVEGLLLGLATGASCLSVCAPIILPYLATSDRQDAKSCMGAVVQFCAGRLGGYAAIVLTALIVGPPLLSSPAARRLLAVSLLLLAGLMVAYGLGVSFPASRWCARVRNSALSRRFPWLSGLLIGLAPCPPLLLCAGAAASSASLASGLMCLLGFLTGTSVFTLPLAVGGVLGRVSSLRGAAEVAALVAGLWFLANGMAVLIS